MLRPGHFFMHRQAGLRGSQSFLRTHDQQPQRDRDLAQLEREGPGVDRLHVLRQEHVGEADDDPGGAIQDQPPSQDAWEPAGFEKQDGHGEEPTPHSTSAEITSSKCRRVKR